MDEDYQLEIGMCLGVQAYNEARGCGLEEPEPCGHHCSSECPRCGEEEVDDEEESVLEEW